MTKTYKLHELIEMAKAGKKFDFESVVEGVPTKITSNDLLLDSYHFSPVEIVKDFSIRLWPEVVEFEAKFFDSLSLHTLLGHENAMKLRNKRWKFVATEVVG